MLLCSVIAKCNDTNDTQQADKLFADKREPTLQSIGGRVLMLVSVYRVSNTQQNKELDTCTTQNRSCKADSFVPTPGFQSTIGKNLNFPFFYNTVWILT